MSHSERAAEPVDTEPSSVEAIVEGLRWKFGDSAGEVAASQLEAASPETVCAWIEVAARLKAGSPKTNGEFR